MIKPNRRGSILVHVLITGVIVAFIAAGLLRMVLMNFIAIEQAAKSARNRKEAEAMLNRALTYWNESHIVCSHDAGFPCTPSYVTSPGTCSCDCPNDQTLPRVEVRGGGAPPCAITIISADPE